VQTANQWHSSRRLAEITFHLRLHDQTGSFGKPALPTIERKKGLRAAFEGQSDMEQVNCALPFLAGVFVAQLVRQSENVRPN
jgi:hypothetical protein